MKISKSKNIYDFSSLILSLTVKKLNFKITAVFFNSGYFEILIYFEGIKVSSEVISLFSFSLFIEDFLNSFNASELIMLD